MGGFPTKPKKPVQPIRSATAQLNGTERNNEDIRDRYELGKLLGSGGFGQVREAVLKDASTEEPRAVKVIERDSRDDEWSKQAIFVREVSLLQQMEHENIIKYYDFYEDDMFLYVVMEMCRGGEVFGKIIELRRFSEKDAAFLGKQMLRAIDYIHKLRIVHRDIKAENFMLAEPSLSAPIKLIDFGMACKMEEGQMLTELCGSPHYLAREVIQKSYTEKADMWAFGVLLYLLMYGHYPYDGKTPREIMKKVLSDAIRWQTKAKLSANGLEFVQRLLEPDAKRRLSAEDALTHAWIPQEKVVITVTSADEEEGEAFPQEVLRNAHRAATRHSAVDPKIEAVREEKLRKIDEDFKAGIRHGSQRLGMTRKEPFMSKPEFVRRENQLTTAPSRELSVLAGNTALGELTGRIDRKPGSAGDMNMVDEAEEDFELRTSKSEGHRAAKGGAASAEDSAGWAALGYGQQTAGAAGQGGDDTAPPGAVA